MTKREALHVLIRQSDLLTEEFRTKLLTNLSEFSDDDVESIGKFLARAEKVRISSMQQLLGE